MTMIRLRNLERSYPLGHGKFFYVLRDINLPFRVQDSLIRLNDRKYDLLIDCFRGKRSTLLYQICAMDRFLSVEGIKQQPPTGEPRREIFDGFGLVQRVKGEIRLREPLLPQTCSEHVHRIVAPRHVLNEANLG